MIKRAFILTEDETGLSGKYHTFDEKGNLQATQDVACDSILGFVGERFFPPAPVEEVEITINDQPLEIGSTSAATVEVGGEAVNTISLAKSKKKG